MELKEFEEIIENSVERIPEEFSKILKKENIELLARERVPEVLQKKFKGSFVFGVFIGTPHPDRSVFNIQQESTRIELYRESFERAFSRKSEMEEQIVKTVIHEIGHYFGFSEKELRKYL